MAEFIQTFDFLARFDCIPAIDQMFLKLINDDWSTESIDTNKHLIVCFLRANGGHAVGLEYYDEFLSKSIKYLESHNIDPLKLLKGII